MGAKQSLYEMLGVGPGAGVPEMQAAYRLQVGQLEAAKAAMSPQDFDFKSQLLRVALNTLVDPVSRLGYDAKLAAAAQAAQAAAPETRDLALRVQDPQAAAAAIASAEKRAEALSLRADALALRADAMMVRAGLEPQGDPRGTLLKSIAGGSVTLLKRTVSALGIVVVLGIGVFFMVRGDAGSRRLAEQKAAEQTALQEYYQTHGVRPASLAEMELLEAERRRRDNEARQTTQDRDKQDRDQKRFEQESQQMGRQAAEDVRRQQEQANEFARREAEQELYRKQREADLRLSQQQQREYLEQQRLERERRQWRETLKEN